MRETAGSDGFRRRDVLRASLGVMVAGGAFATGTAAAPVAAAREQAVGTAPSFPPVPGMRGNRRANELWYQFDEATLYHPAPELTEAYAAVTAHVGNLEVGMRDLWLRMSEAPGYPDSYADRLAPVAGPLGVISRVQLAVFDRYYRPWSGGLVRAFADFGQGVLFDPRRAEVQAEVHTMNGTPPIGYHIWHAYIRAMMLLGIDRARWQRLAPCNAFAWAVQSTAKPDGRAVNAPLPRRTVRRLAADWLPRGVRQLDRDFHSLPYPEGIE